MSVVLITGPARGIGAALARRLAARGDTLSLVGMEPELLAALATELESGHAWFECDVTDQGSLDRAVEETARRFGRIDVVVANAGIASAGTVAITPVEALARVIEVNLVGVIRTVRTTMPHLLASRGYYLLVASAAALAPTPGLAAYGAAKSGVEQFGNGLRLELAEAGVGVGVAYPSWIDTDLVRDASEMETFLARLAQLPGPFGTITPLDVCIDALARAIEKREARVFVPKSLARFAAIRQLFTSRLGDWLARRQLRAHLPKMEQEINGRGTTFGRTSVESTRRRS